MSFVTRLFPVPAEITCLYQEAWSRISDEHQSILSAMGVREPVDLYHVVGEVKTGNFLFRGCPLLLPELEAYLSLREHLVLLRVPRDQAPKTAKILPFR